MNLEPSHIALPLESLFVRLEAAGFSMDTSRKLRLLRALEREGGRYVGRWDELKYLLAPFAARTAEEQRRFYTLYEAFQLECAEELDRLFASPAESPAEETPPSPLTALWKRYWWGLFPILAMLIGLGLKIFTPKAPYYVRLHMDKNVEAREGQVLHIDNLTDNILNRDIDTSGFRWEVIDLATGQLEFADTTFDLKWPATNHGEDKLVILHGPEGREETFTPEADSLTLRVQCADPPRIERMNFPESPLVRGQSYMLAIETEPGVEVAWYGVEIEEQADGGRQIRTTFNTQGTATVRFRVYRPEHPEDCYVERTQNFTVGAEKPFLKTAALRMDEPSAHLTIASWMWLLLAPPFLLAAWFARRWRRRRNDRQVARSAEELEAAYPIHDAGPYYVPYLPQNEKITVPPAFFRIADVLRRREAGIRRVFDAPRSVLATAESGGFPSWRDRPLTHPAEYLLLARRTDERQQQDRLFQRLAHFLERRDAPVTVFYHDGRFDRFRNDRYPEGLSLLQIYRRYGHYRLVVLGDAHGLVNPHATNEPALLVRPMAELQRWPRRLLLTPEAPVDWSFQEALLHRYFRVFPATTAGILDGTEALDRDEEYIPIHFTRWQREMAEQYEEPSGRYRTWDRPETYRDYLAGDPDLYRWLCALAVTDQPDWALTIAIGRALGLEVTHDRLLRLSRIPWLAENQSNTTLRLALLAELDPADERLARQAVTEELERVEDKIQRSFAQTEWTATRAVQYFALDPRDESLRQAIRELRDLGLLSGGQLSELDYIVREQADTRGLPAGANRDLNAWLDTPAPRPAWTTDLLLSTLFLALTLALGLLGRWYNNRGLEAAPGQTAQFWQAAQLLDDEALRLNNRAVGIGQRMDALTSWTDYRSYGDSMTLADSLLGRAMQLRLQAQGIRRPYGNYPLADSNQLYLRFNYAARRLNFFLADSADAEVLRQLPGEFNRAARTYLWDDNADYNTSRSITDLSFISFLFRQAKGYQLDRNQALAALHGHGLSLYYLAVAGEGPTQASNVSPRFGAPRGPDPVLIDSARQVRQFLLDHSNGAYFDSIRPTMPVNLATLLDALPESSARDSVPPARQEPRIAYLTLTGRVLDAETRAPLVKVLVRAADARRSTETSLAAGTAPAMLTGVTGLDGRYRLTNVPDNIGRLRLYAVAPPGYSSASEQSGLQRSLPELLLQPAPRNVAETDPRQVQQAPPEPAYVVTGRVLDAAAGQPVIGATVLAQGTTTSTVTDADGRYSLSLPEGTGVLIFSYAGYDQQAVPINSRTTIDVRLGSGPQQIPRDLPVIEPEMVRVEGGTFTMGCLPERDGECGEGETPAHQVQVSSFYMGKYEVTNEEFAAFLNDYKSDIVKTGPYAKQLIVEPHEWGVQNEGDTWRPARGHERHPIVNVTWYGAFTYAQWLSEKTGKNYRLPTEAEWEYAARGGADGRGYRYAGSNDLGEVAWNNQNADRRTHPFDESLKVLKPNELGLYNMSGNVWEWCSDWYGADYYQQFGKGAAVDPQGPADGEIRVARGGSWNGTAINCRSSYRGRYHPINRNYNVVGFRVVRRP